MVNIKKPAPAETVRNSEHGQEEAWSPYSAPKKDEQINAVTVDTANDAAIAAQVESEEDVAE